MGDNSKKILEMVTTAPNRGHTVKVEHSDPEIETEMALSPLEINLYDRNPRRADNESYDSLKLSIEKRGYTGVLEISRRPGDDKFMVCAGANTTLSIIKELLESNNDRRFKKIRCLFKPWESESVTIFNHLIENDTHGRVTFIDKADGILDAKRHLEREKGTELSQREFCKVAREHGLNIDSSMFSRYQYASEVLGTLIPNALASGLGQPQIKKIRKLQNALEKHLQFHGAEEEVSKLIEDQFFEFLSDYDFPIKGSGSSSATSFWDLAPVHRRTEEYLATSLNLPLQTVRIEIATLLEKGELTKTVPPEYQPLIPEKKTNASSNNATQSQTSLKTSDEDKNQDSEPDASNRGTPGESESDTPTDSPLVDFSEFDDSDGEGSSQEDQAGLPFSEAPSESEENFPIESNDISTGASPKSEVEPFNLQEECYTNALSLGEIYGISDLIHKIDAGIGFFLEFPEKPFHSSDDYEHTPGFQAPSSSCLWYQLAVFTEQVNSESVQSYMEKIPQNTRVSQAIERLLNALELNAQGLLPEDQTDDLYPLESCIGPEPGLEEMSEQLFSELDGHGLESLIKIQRVYWNQRQEVRRQDKNYIWEL